MRRDRRRWSLARQVLVLLTAAVIVVITAAVLAAYLQARSAAYDAARAQVLSVAETVASAPSVTAALASPDPSMRLQPFAEQVRRRTHTDFVVVMSPAGLRYSHPDPQQIGQRFLGHIEPALSGRSFTETYTGTLGPSVRSVVPVTSGGQTVGLVSVGITLDTVSQALAAQVPALLLAGGVTVAASTIGLLLLSRRLRRQTHGMGPEELSRLYEFYDAVLHAVREGLLLLDTHGRVRLVNDEGRRLLALPPDVAGQLVADLDLPSGLHDTLLDEHGRVDDIQLTADRVLVVSKAPASWQGHRLGSVITLRDHTDLLALTGELDSVKGFAEALRSQAHEAANRLHTMIALIELGHTGRALEFATAELDSAQALTDRVVGAGQEPVLAALLLGKAAQANERGVELVIEDALDLPELALPARDLITILGNLIDNAIDAASSAPPPRRVRVSAQIQDEMLVLEVADTGPGIDPAHAGQVFRRGWSTKGTDQDGADGGPGGADGGSRVVPGRGLGLALVEQAVRRLDGRIDLRDGVRGAVFDVELPLPAHAPPGQALTDQALTEQVR